MSLKSFHIVFILASIFISGFLSYWSFKNEVSPQLTWMSGLVSFALAVYGVFFIRKAKNIIT